MSCGKAQGACGNRFGRSQRLSWPQHIYAELKDELAALECRGGREMGHVKIRRTKEWGKICRVLTCFSLSLSNICAAEWALGSWCWSGWLYYLKTQNPGILRISLKHWNQAKWLRKVIYSSLGFSLGETEHGFSRRGWCLWSEESMLKSYNPRGCPVAIQPKHSKQVGLSLILGCDHDLC